jgi:hypothetical protein
MQMLWITGPLSLKNRRKKENAKERRKNPCQHAVATAAFLTNKSNLSSNAKPRKSALVV